MSEEEILALSVRAVPAIGNAREPPSQLLAAPVLHVTSPAANAKSSARNP